LFPELVAVLIVFMALLDNHAVCGLCSIVPLPSSSQLQQLALLCERSSGFDFGEEVLGAFGECRKTLKTDVL
jgi:hypothetical protein